MSSGRKCIMCGRCRETCPVYRAVLKETAAPRAKGILDVNGMDDRIFYLCTLCGACKEGCPVDADLRVVEHRARLVEKGQDTGPSRRMIESLRKYGHPFGDEVTDDLQEQLGGSDDGMDSESGLE